MLVVVAGLLAGAIAAAVDVGSDSHPSTAPSGTPSGTPTAAASPSASSTPTPSPTPTAPANPDLFTPPTQFVYVPDETASTGPIDAAQAAELDGTGALSEVGLQQLGFVRGVSRQWRAEPTVLVDLVYTFRTEAQARAYVRSLTTARKNDTAYQRATPPAGAPAGATVFTNVMNGSHSATAVFASGTHAVVIGLVAPNTDPDLGLLASLASAQATVSAGS